MENYEIEEKINDEFTKAVPDVLASVLSDINSCTHERNVISMEEKKIKHRTNRWVKWAACAAAVILIASAVFGIGFYRTNYSTDMMIALDVNPSIEIRVNRKDTVLEVIPKNEDAEAVIGNMDFKGSKIDVTVNAIIGSMLRNGYLSDISNSILISVDGTDDKRSSELLSKLTDEVNGLLQTDAFTGSVLSQTINSNDTLKNLADTYGITPGKAQLIQKIIGNDPRYTFESLSGLSINQLNLILNSNKLALDDVDVVGSASDRAYIGEIKAKEIALNDAKVAENDIREYRISMDYEHGTMVYEIEFKSGIYEYEYDINAVTGDIVERDSEYDDDHYDSEHGKDTHGSTGSGTGTAGGNTGGNSGSSTGNTTDNTGSGTAGGASGSTDGYIGEERAKAAALTHAGLKESDVSNMIVKLDRDDGRYVYDVEFLQGNTEYDYEIDAVTGNVLKYDKDIEEHAHSGNNTGGTAGNGTSGSTGGSSGSSTGNTTDNTGSGTAGSTSGSTAGNTGNYIGEDSAKVAALAHAGLKESDVTNMIVKLDRDDGRYVYDVEFLQGNTEYDYEIDAVSGNVLKYDKDIEDHVHSGGSTGNTGSGNTGSGTAGGTSGGTAGTTGNYIGEDSAKAAALAHAGFKESDVSNIKIKLDRDDGRYIYEIEFRNGRYEYEYDIDALTGNIIDFDIDD